MARLTHGLGLTAALLITAGTAHAANFNQLLASPNRLPPTRLNSGTGLNSTWFNGTGNPQGGWVIDSERRHRTRPPRKATEPVADLLDERQSLYRADRDHRRRGLSGTMSSRST